MFIILSGSSGAGKNTVINELFKKDKRLQKFVTYTTRDMREGEVNHINYHFISREEFENRQANGEFLEVESIHGNMYGSSAIDLVNAISNGQIVINDFGVEGVKNLQEKLKGKVDFITIFLSVPKETLRQRLIERGDKAESIETRMNRYDYESSFASSYDYVIENINLDETLNTIQGIINKKLCNKEREQ